MAKRRVVNMAAILVIVAASAFLLWFFFPTPPRPDLKPHRALGTMLAQEAIQRLGSSGRLILITRDTASFEMPVVRAQVDSFQKAIEKAHVSAAITRVLKVDPLRVVNVPPGDFLEILRKCGEKDVIVSLLGPPLLTDEQFAKLGEKRPEILAVCTGAMPGYIDLKRLFDRKLLRAAVISRQEPAASPDSGQSLQDSFKQMFRWITPDNLADLPMVKETK